MLAPRYRASGRVFAELARHHPELTALRRDLHRLGVDGDDDGGPCRCRCARSYDTTIGAVER